eukprot:3421960-Karenia_brevis.AAC.1
MISPKTSGGRRMRRTQRWARSPIGRQNLVVAKGESKDPVGTGSVQSWMEEQGQAYVSTAERQQALQRAQSACAKMTHGAKSGFQHV